MEIRISLLATGATLLDGAGVDLAQLDARLLRADTATDHVLYFKEDQTEASAAGSLEIVKLVAKHKLAISFSTKPDFSNYVDRSGQSHSRPANAERPKDPFAPFMPDVDLRRNVHDVLEEARSAASKMPDGRGVALVGPDRLVMVLPVPACSPAMDAQVPKLPIPLDRQCNITVIANTGLLCAVQGQPPDIQKVAGAIPFFGLLIAWGYAGHCVWIFEGHPSALAAGLDHADLLLVDSGMLPFLQSDWMAVAQRTMAPNRVLIYSREHKTLLPAVPASNPEGWAYSEPDGEASYVRCLLTTLAKSYAGASAEIIDGLPLPDLAGLTQNPEELAWIAGLPFHYRQLDARKCIEMLTAKRSVVQRLKKEWVMKALLVTEGEPKTCQFALRLGGGQARQTLSIRVI